MASLNQCLSASAIHPRWFTGNNLGDVTPNDSRKS